jgi:hypothetical protein
VVVELVIERDELRRVVGLAHDFLLDAMAV